MFVNRIVVIASLAAASHIANASVSLNAQSRQVSVGGWDIPANAAVSDSQSAPGFGLFDVAYAAIPPNFPNGTVWAPTSQRSNISTTQISGQGSARGNYYFLGAGQYPSFAGQTSFSVTFSVDAPTPFTLVASGPHFERYFGEVVADGYVRLRDDASGTILHSSEPARPPVADPIFNDFASTNAQPLDVAGILQPGSYTLSAFALGSTYRFTSGQPNTFNSAFNFNMVIPSPATGAMLALAGACALRRRRA